MAYALNAEGSLVSESARKLAEELVEGVTLLSALGQPFNVTELGWALRDLCFSTWNSDPKKGTTAAELLGQLCKQLESANSDATKLELRALHHWCDGLICVVRGNMADAVDRFDNGAADFRELGRELHAAQTQVAKIMALSMLGQYEAASECAHQAQADFLRLDDTHAAAKVALNLGALNDRRGDFEQAAHHSRNAAVYFARARDNEHSIMADINLANALSSLGDFDEAQRIYARAKRRAESHGFPKLQTLADESAALLQLARGNYQAALSGLEQARSTYEQLQLPQPLAIVEKQLADTYLELHLLPEAKSLFATAVGRFSTLNVPDERAWALCQLGRVEALMGEADTAAETFATAAGLFDEQQNSAGIATVALARAELALLKLGYDHAQVFAKRAIVDFDLCGLTDGRLRASLVCAQASLDTGDTETAESIFQTLHTEAKELQLLTVQVRCLIGLGLIAATRSDRDAAEHV